MKPIVIVSKQTSYSKMLDEHSDFNDQTIIKRWKESHDRHFKALDVVSNILERYGTVFNVSVSCSEALTQFNALAMVVTVGGDGTLLGASHHISSETPVIGVNSDPDTSVGFFCTTTADDLEEYVKRVIDGTNRKTVLTRMMVKKNDKVVSKRVLNDVLYCHTNPATTSSYVIDISDGKSTVSYPQKSSGFWVGPAAGSTGARRSAGFDPMDLSSEEIQLCVRELYRKPGQQGGMNFIPFSKNVSVGARSKMATAAMYVDGHHQVVPVELGDYVSFGVSDEPLILVGKPQCTL